MTKSANTESKDARKQVGIYLDKDNEEGFDSIPKGQRNEVMNTAFRSFLSQHKETLAQIKALNSSLMGAVQAGSKAAK